jgi:hypothetical protein
MISCMSSTGHRAIRQSEKRLSPLIFGRGRSTPRVYEMVQLAIKTSIENDRGKMRIVTGSKNLRLRQSPFRHARSDLKRRIPIQHLKCSFHSQTERSPLERCHGTKMDPEASSVGCAQETFESFLSCVRTYPECARSVFFAQHSTHSGTVSRPRVPRFHQ